MKARVALIAAPLLLTACVNADAADPIDGDGLSAPFGKPYEQQCIDTGDVQTSGSWGVQTEDDTSMPGYPTPAEAMAGMTVGLPPDWAKLSPEEVTYELAWGDGAEVQVLATNIKTGNIMSGIAVRTEQGGWYIESQGGCNAGTVTKGTAGRQCEITGTAGRDKLRGTRQDDLICGRGGNDVIRGRGGHDTLIGGGGNDVLRGGRADDTLQGGSDQDFLYSRHRGHDLNTLRGNSGHDVFLTRDGHIDIINGGNKTGEWDIACTDHQDVLRSAQHRDVCPGGPPTAEP